MKPGLSLLDARRSTPSRLLGAPGPTEAEIETLLQSALRVPDHGRLQPWRLILIHGDARHALGETLVTLRKLEEPALSQAEIDKDRQRFSHAPLVVTVVARLTAGHKIPEQEQLCSAAALCQNLLLAATGLGYGAQWLTGWPAYHRSVARSLGLLETERVVGFIHIGSAQGEVEERLRPSLKDVVSEWRAADSPGL